MNTQKLYYDDSYRTEFEAEILQVLPYEDAYAVILDKTCFYPESGGQPSDKGTINGNDILHIIEKQGSILHITQNRLEPGPARCQLDWSVRFDHMQQHSGQHILSACFYKLFRGETSSFHIGKESSTIEIDVQSFDMVMAEQLEAMVNTIVFSDSALSSRIVGKEELASLPLRKQPLVDSNIRIVTIENCDCTPCGGTHVRRTGEIGLVKIKKWEKLKSSYKFDFVCGNRALKDYTFKNHVMNKLGAFLSAPEQEVEAAFVRYTEDYKSLQKQMSQLRSEVITHEVQRLQLEAEVINECKVICRAFDNRDFNDVKLMAQSLAAEPSCIALLASKGQNSQLIFARSENVDVNMNTLLKEILPMLNGKGGGSPKAAQGGGSGDVEGALAAALAWLKK